MSRYHGNGQRCPFCDLTYKRLKTGLTYRQVYELLKDYSDDPTDWTYKRRGTVLGKWHQIKKELWEWHLYECQRQAEFEDAQEPPPELCRDVEVEGVPF